MTASTTFRVVNDTLQHAKTLYNKLQDATTSYNTLQHLWRMEVALELESTNSFSTKKAIVELLIFDDHLLQRFS
jgi:uncharacterized membrane protein YjjP (DUF1212 family)